MELQYVSTTVKTNSIQTIRTLDVHSIVHSTLDISEICYASELSEIQAYTVL